MVQTRENEYPEDERDTGLTDVEGEALSIDERRERRRARRRQQRDDDPSDVDESDSLDDDEDSVITTAPKDARTRSRREAMRAREKDARRRGESLPLVGGIVRYFRDVIAEVQKVTWPTREEARRLTIIVIAVTIFFAIMLGSIDLFYGWWFELGVADTGAFLLVAIPFFLIAGGLSWYYILREPT